MKSIIINNLMYNRSLNIYKLALRPACMAKENSADPD